MCRKQLVAWTRSAPPDETYSLFCIHSSVWRWPSSVRIMSSIFLILSHCMTLLMLLMAHTLQTHFQCVGLMFQPCICYSLVLLTLPFICYSHCICFSIHCTNHLSMKLHYPLFQPDSPTVQVSDTQIWLMWSNHSPILSAMNPFIWHILTAQDRASKFPINNLAFTEQIFVFCCSIYL